MFLEKDHNYITSMNLTSLLESMLGDFHFACDHTNKFLKLVKITENIAMVAENHRAYGDYKGPIESNEKVHRITSHYSTCVKVYYLYSIMMKTYEEQRGDYEFDKNTLEQLTQDYL